MYIQKDGREKPRLSHRSKRIGAMTSDGSMGDWDAGKSGAAAADGQADLQRWHTAVLGTDE